MAVAAAAVAGARDAAPHADWPRPTVQRRRTTLMRLGFDSTVGGR